MRRVLSDHAAAGGRQPRHKAFKLPREDGTERSVAAWFDEAPEEMMGALARSSWITPGSVTDSTFFTEVLGPEGMMAGVLPPEDEDVIRRWVDAGCPPPKAGMRSAPLAAEPADERFATRRLTIGHGSVH
jgi:hypothetical protein